MSLDLKDFFLATPMPTPEYMKVPFKYFPQDIVQKYNLTEKIHKDYIFIKISKGMYGLKQAAVLAYENLIKNLKPFGYEPIPHTDSYWRHKTYPTKFCLCVDDFGIKYFTKTELNHLIKSLQYNYKISTDFSGRNYYGLTIEWDYIREFVDVSMPDYIPKALTKFQYKPNVPQFSPHPYNRPNFGAKIQYPSPPDESRAATPKETKHVQSIAGTFLYYCRAIDPTMIVALNDIAAVQSKPTADTLKKCNRLMDYAATYPNAKLRYFASDMVLHVDSDAAYLVQSNARSRIAGYYILSTYPPPPPSIPQPAPNAPILVECKTLRTVVASAAEAETGGLFHNGQTTIHIRRLLQALGHPQPPTPLKTDNSTSHAFVNKSLRQKRSKSWDMRFHWLRDKEREKYLRVFWDKGKRNGADYFTKHHPAPYHKLMRSKYILTLHHISQKLCKHIP